MSQIEVDINGFLHQFEVLGVEEFHGQTLIGIFNDRRDQYEVYTRTQKPMVCPMGADDYELEVAFLDAEECLCPPYLEGEEDEEFENLQEELDRDKYDSWEELNPF